VLNLGDVILAWPKHLNDPAQVQKINSTRSWIQLARTGAFTSNRYGKFSITKDDLSMMLQNFSNVTPMAPTELPIDYDHLSMDPKKPGDGIAAGWMKKLELRANGDELWAEVEWTPTGASRVENGEYRYVSPSFVKDHTHKDGKKIGTTLLAAAITNHPFLEGMSALTLYNFSALGDLAMDAVADAAVAVNLSEVGQRVMIAPGNARTMDETGGSFEIVEVVGQGEDAFLSLQDANGVVHKWFRSTEVLPATATPAPPNLQPGVPNPDAVGVPEIDPLTGKPVQPAMTLEEAKALEASAAAAVLAAVTPEEKAAAAVLEEEAAAAVLAAEAALNADPEATDPAATDPAAAEGDPKADPDAAADAEETLETREETPDDAGDEPVDDEEAAKQLKKVVRALSSAPQHERVTNMMFTLRNDKNEEFKVTDKQLADAGIRVVPEGSEAIPTSELAALKADVTNLSDRVNDAAKSAAKMRLTAKLDEMSAGALITPMQRAYALSQWGEGGEGFEAWAATFKTPIVSLNKSHGSGNGQGEGGGDGGGEDEGKDAQNRIISLANTIAKDRGLAMRDALIQASAQLPEDAEMYREQFAQRA